MPATVMPTLEPGPEGEKKKEKSPFEFAFGAVFLKWRLKFPRSHDHLNAAL